MHKEKSGGGHGPFIIDVERRPDPLLELHRKYIENRQRIWKILASRQLHLVPNELPFQGLSSFVSLPYRVRLPSNYMSRASSYEVEILHAGSVHGGQSY